MIFWNDFFLDPKFGPTLVFRTEGLGLSSVMEDASTIQETGQEAWPARMVGFTSLESNSIVGMDAERGPSAEPVRTEGGA